MVVSLKGRRLGACLVPLLFFAILGCRQEIEVSPVGAGSSSDTLLINTSFEFAGNPSLVGWVPSDDAFVDFSTQVPSGGGSWSVSIDADTGPPASITSLVEAKTGQHVYRLAVWGKSSGPSGTAAILLKTPESLEPVTSAAVADTAWSFISLLDTLATEEGDSIGVRLSGGISEIGVGTAYFDLCVLEQFEPSTE